MDSPTDQGETMSDSEQEVIKPLKVTAPILSYLNNADELPQRKQNQSFIIGGEDFSKFEEQLISSNTESGNGFVAVVSLHDANTLYVSSGITSTLGYPQDMLVGQSIMGFLYPKDRLTFANLLSRGLQSRFCHANESPIDSDGRFVFHTRIREYKGLRNCGFDIVGKKPTCKPFQLRCFVRDVATAERMSAPEFLDNEPKEQSRLDLLTMCFVIVAIPIKSAHKLSEEKNPAMVPFLTRHTSTCHFSYVDHSSIAFLGYFPQDMIGFSIFNFYHEEDFATLKETYYKVSIDASSSIRGKPVRFRVFNGDYVLLETEWSSFVNPWTRKIEFMIGNHRIIQGPKNIDVFDDAHSKTRNDISPDSKSIQNEIIEFLSKPVSKTVLNQITHESSGIKRKRKLAAHVNDIIDGRVLTNKEWSDKYSCVLGAVSPNLESSESSSDTPPPYQEERLKDNIERFFASQPQTNCETCPSSESSSQNNERSPDRTRSNGSGSSDPKKGHSSVDSAFQSGSNEGSGNGNGAKSSSNQQSRQLIGDNTAFENVYRAEDENEKMSPEEIFHRNNHDLKKSFRNLTEEALTYHNRLLRHKHQTKIPRKASIGNENQESQGNQRRPGNSQEGSNHIRRSSTKKRNGPDESSKRGIRGQETNMPQPTSLYSPPFSMMLPMTWMPQVMPQNLCSACSSNIRQEQLQSNQVMLPVLCAMPFSVSSNPSVHPSSFPMNNGFTSTSDTDNRTRGHQNPVTAQEEFAQRRSSRLRTDFASVCRQLFPSGDDERQKNVQESKNENQNHSGDDGQQCHSFNGERESTGFSFSTSSSSLLPSSSESPNQYHEYLSEEKIEKPKPEIRKRYKVEPNLDDMENGIEHQEQQPQQQLIHQQLQLLADDSSTSDETFEQNRGNEIEDNS